MPQLENQDQTDNQSKSTDESEGEQDKLDYDTEEIQTDSNTWFPVEKIPRTKWNFGGLLSSFMRNR
jgi:hypothetical protein